MCPIANKTENRTRVHGMGMSMEKSKASHDQLPRWESQRPNEWRLIEEASSFKHLGPIFHAEGSSYEEIRARIGLATTGTARLKLTFPQQLR